MTTGIPLTIIGYIHDARILTYMTGTGWELRKIN